eukprot:gene12590-14558_t
MSVVSHSPTTPSYSPEPTMSSSVNDTVRNQITTAPSSVPCLAPSTSPAAGPSAEPSVAPSTAFSLAPSAAPSPTVSPEASHAPTPAVKVSTGSPTLPPVGEEASLSPSALIEVKRHHRYLTLFTAPEGDSGDKLRIVTGVQLLSTQTMLMFLLAMLYDVQSPSDDGTCSAHATEDSCLNRKSVFDSTVSYCQWQLADDLSSASCLYRDPVFSLKVILYISVIVAILTAVISYPSDIIFDLLSAPVADDAKAAAQDSAIKALGRRVSNVARRASNAAMSAVTAVKNKFIRNKYIVGTVTRKLPGDTEAAHALATASMTVIVENSRQSMVRRQLTRMRTYHESGGKYGVTIISDDDLSSASGSDADSSSESDFEGENKQRVESTNEASICKKIESALSFACCRNKVSPAEDLVIRDLLKLSEEINCQRRLLRPSEVDQFDTQWGLDPTGEFSQGERSVVSCLRRSRPGAEAIILDELKFYLGTAPFVIHRMFVRFLQPFVLSGLLLLWQFIMSNVIFIVITVFLGLMVLIYGLFRRYHEKKLLEKTQNVAPVAAEYLHNTHTERDDREGYTHQLHLPHVFALQLPVSDLRQRKSLRHSQECSGDSKEAPDSDGNDESDLLSIMLSTNAHHAPSKKNSVKIMHSDRSTDSTESSEPEQRERSLLDSELSSLDLPAAALPMSCTAFSARAKSHVRVPHPIYASSNSKSSKSGGTVSSSSTSSSDSSHAPAPSFSGRLSGVAFASTPSEPVCNQQQDASESSSCWSMSDISAESLPMPP